MFSLHPESCLVLCISLSNNKSVLLYIYIYIYIYIHICTTIRVLKYNFWALRTIFPCGRWVLMRMEYNPTVEQRSNVFKTILKGCPGRWHHLLSFSWSNSDKLTSIYATMVSWTYLSRCKTKQHFDIVCWTTVAVLDPLLGPAQQNLFTNASVTNTN